MGFIKVVGAATIGLLLAGPASAIDMCFEAGNGFIFVAKGFKRPPPGKCRSLAGYEASTAIPHPATGTACLNASGSKLYVYWSTMLDSGGFTPSEFHSRTEYPYPALIDGETTYHFVSPSQNFYGNTLTDGVRCVPAPLP